MAARWRLAIRVRILSQRRPWASEAGKDEDGTSLASPYFSYMQGLAKDIPHDVLLACPLLRRRQWKNLYKAC